MAKIYKVSGYFIDFEDCYSDGELEFAFYNGTECFTQHLHVQASNIEDWNDNHPLNFNNCDLAECEKYFKAEPTVSNDRPLPQAGELYKHFKNGKIVEVVGVSQDTENVGSYSVVYICKDKDNNGKLWHRPLDMFLSKVDADKYPEHAGKWRFEKL